MSIQSPDWPYEFNDDDDNDPERIKYDEYCDFEYEHSDLLNNYEKTYDELIENRDSLIPQRPEWMNSEIFINYENNDLKYQVNYSHQRRLKQDRKEYKSPI